jgi:NAD-dependent deacetylase
MPFVRTDAVTIHYREEGQGEPIVLVHGNWTTSLWWQPVLARLSGTHRILAPDLRGRGDSRGAQHDYTIGRLAADLALLLDELELPSAHLVGHSLGAAVVLELALKERRRARTITLIAPAWPDGMPAALNLPERQRMAQEDQNLYATALRAVAPTGPDDDLFRALVVEGHKQLPEATMATLDALVAWAPGERLRALRGVPSMVVSGALDGLSTIDVGRRVADLIGARQHVMPAMGHSPNLEAPDAFVGRFRAFLREVEAGNRRGDAAAQAAAIERASAILGQARSALFITGAGISVESGLPTYRGEGGLWTRMAAEEGKAAEAVMSADNLATNPEAVWGHARGMERAGRAARPNAAHEAIARLEARMERVCVLTQNVDGLHRAAGSTNIIDIHGDLHALRCTACAWQARVADYAELEPVPRCPSCGAVIRPDVVFFGEMIPDDKYAKLALELEQGFDVVVSIGTSSLFPYIMEPVFRAADKGKPSIEINPEDTRISSIVTVKLAMPAVLAFTQIMARIEGASGP